MGPFPHDAPPPTISAENPMGTDGFEFVEFCHPGPGRARSPVHGAWGSTPWRSTAPRRVTLYRQGRVNLVVNAEPGSFAARFAAGAWPVGAGDGLPGGRRRPRLRARAVARRQARRDAPPGPTSSVFPPSKASAGCTSISSIATARRARSTTWTSSGSASPIRAGRASGSGTFDHLTHNVHRGRLDEWAGFYERSSTSGRSATSTSRAG